MNRLRLFPQQPAGSTSVRTELVSRATRHPQGQSSGTPAPPRQRRRCGCGTPTWTRPGASARDTMGSGAAPEPTRAGGTAGHGAGGAAARGAPSLFPFSPWGRPAQVTPASAWLAGTPTPTPAVFVRLGVRWRLCSLCSSFSWCLRTRGAAPRGPNSHPSVPPFLLLMVGTPWGPPFRTEAVHLVAL